VKDHFGEVDEVDAVVVLVLEEVEQLLNLLLVGRLGSPGWVGNGVQRP
jgi:hypothetical protein